jgi:hypothetical protein
VVDPHFKNGVLQISIVVQGWQDYVAAVYDILMYLIKWEMFTTARWLQQGKACRNFLRCLSVGVERVAKSAKDDPTCGSAYYLGGFLTLSKRMKKYAALTSFVAYVCDVVGNILIEDSRLVLVVGEVETAVNEELKYIGVTDEYVWRRCAELIGDANYTWQEFRSDALDCCYTAVAFLHKRFLSVAKGLPWSLAVGNIENNIRNLGLEDATRDPDCSLKIYKRRLLGYNVNQLAFALRLIANLSWTTVLVEQGHGSCGILHIYHPWMSAQMLALRALFHQMRSMFSIPRDAAVWTRMRQQLDRLNVLLGGHICGKQVYFLN